MIWKRISDPAKFNLIFKKLSDAKRVESIPEDDDEGNVSHDVSKNFSMDNLPPQIRSQIMRDRSYDNKLFNSFVNTSSNFDNGPPDLTVRPPAVSRSFSVINDNSTSNKHGVEM